MRRDGIPQIGQDDDDDEMVDDDVNWEYSSKIL